MLQYWALHKSYSELLYCHHLLRLCGDQDDINETATTFQRERRRSLQIHLPDHVTADSGLLSIPRSYRHR